MIKQRFLALFFLILIIFGAFGVKSFVLAWTLEVVDTEEGYYPIGLSSIALDSSNNVHISYYNYTTSSMMYATNASGSWESEVVDSDRWVGDYNSIALDSADYVHISYFDDTNGDLKYATNSWVSGIWSKKTVDSAGNSGLFTSIAIDSSNNVHISYYNTWGYLKHATGTFKSFTTESVASGVDIGYNPNTSIAIDSLDNVHISYYVISHTSGKNPNALRYATNASGSWERTVVSSSGRGMHHSIAVDSLNHAHISYSDDTNRNLDYATNASGSWKNECVDSEGDVGIYPSIAIDSSDNVHISYCKCCDSTSGELKYATNTPIPDIKVNGSDEPVTLDQSDTLTIPVALDNNGQTDNADWWLAADTPSGIYFFTFEGWTTEWVPAHQGPLFYLHSFDAILNMPLSGLPAGAYTLYFGVDTNMDSNVTWDSVYYDTVVVNVTE